MGRTLTAIRGDVRFAWLIAVQPTLTLEESRVAIAIASFADPITGALPSELSAELGVGDLGAVVLGKSGRPRRRR
jgi:hypothetical protein